MKLEEGTEFSFRITKPGNFAGNVGEVKSARVVRDAPSLNYLTVEYNTAGGVYAGSCVAEEFERRRAEGYCTIVEWIGRSI